MAIVRRSPLDPYPVTPKYLATRSSALHIPASQFKNIKFKPEEVYGVIVDMPLSQTAMVTMVCFINGAANLYFNNGAEYTGASTRYKSVVQAARNLVVNATQLKDISKRTSQFPLPTSGQNVYLMTKKGIYKAEINTRAMKDEPKEKRVVHYLAQQVMTSLRLAQMRDQEGGKE